MGTLAMGSADALGMFCRLHMKTKRDLPIRASEMGVLIFIHQQNQSSIDSQSKAVTPLQISHFFSIAKPSVTAMVKSLSLQGYLKKETSAEDKRSYMLSLTDKGRDIVDNTYSEYLKSVELLENKMGAVQFSHLIELIKIANGILERGSS